LFEISAKNDKFNSICSILWKLGVTHEFGKPMVDFLFALIELISLFRSYEAKCEQLGCFHRRIDLSLYTPIWRLSPSSILGIRKLETLGYPAVKTASFCVPSVWQNTRVWRTDKTDKQTDRRSIYSACKASFAARCKSYLL